MIAVVELPTRTGERKYIGGGGEGGEGESLLSAEEVDGDRSSIVRWPLRGSRRSASKSGSGLGDGVDFGADAGADAEDAGAGGSDVIHIGASA